MYKLIAAIQKHFSELTQSLFKVAKVVSICMLFQNYLAHVLIYEPGPLFKYKVGYLSCYVFMKHQKFGEKAVDESVIETFLGCFCSGLIRSGSLAQNHLFTVLHMRQCKYCSWEEAVTRA